MLARLDHCQGETWQGVAQTAEGQRLAEARLGAPWRRWGPYLSERQWGTVREDYSADGDAWKYFRTITPAAAPIAGAKTMRAAAKPGIVENAEDLLHDRIAAAD